MYRARTTMAMDLTPGQAQWVVERLLAERRITSSEVRSMLAGLSTEIANIERRLASLREAAGTASVTAQSPRNAAPTRKTRKRAGGKRGHPRGIAGTLAVLLRSIPAAEHAAIAAIRADKGIKAAIAAAKTAAKKA
jgi:hypothetical protein